MKDGIIRKKFNAAVAAQEKTPEGKNTLRVLGALKEVTTGLRDEGFDVKLATRFGATDIDDCFSEEDTHRAAANGAITLSGETLPFMLWDDGYEGGDMYFKINWQGAEIFSMTCTWDENRKRWDDTDTTEDDEEEDYDGGDWNDEDDADATPAKQNPRTPPLQGRIADALIGALAKIDLAQRHTVTGEENLDKAFRVPATLKINPPKGTP